MNPVQNARVFVEARLNEVETDDESRNAYDGVYDDVGLSQSDSFYRWTLDLLSIQPGESYLDISCGRAELPTLAQQKEQNAHGMDLSYSALHYGKAVQGCRNLVAANSQHLPYADNSFHVISNIGSLEHYVDMEMAVRETARVLKPNGRAYILVPNTFSLLTNIWIAFRQGHTSLDPYQPIQRYAARYEWHQLLEQNGLVVQKTLKYDRPWPRTKADFFNYLRHPKDAMRLFLAPFVPLNLCFSFIFVCGKAPG